MKDFVEDLELVRSGWAKSQDVAEIFNKYFGEGLRSPITVEMKKAILQAIIRSCVCPNEIRKTVEEKLHEI